MTDQARDGKAETTDLMKRLAEHLDAIPRLDGRPEKPRSADEWDTRVSNLRRDLAEAESRWREALHAERTMA